ncbi:MAG TPA: replication-associated recombination protein A [Methylomusa anaerophila]|uniref:replication-associated recombination protein A n=1 Tax=Methylomusa anaerophila TaxID=1930071 RepID=UPI0022B2954D|nr:replication-associated recombination protein A [Methylomusa anaerophila]HML87281.1 replication-associated recombination protein A [Methylomusa anaerophila]
MFNTNLFGEDNNNKNFRTSPLAVRMRPRSLEEFIGQEHMLNPGTFLRRAIENDNLPSIILFGPPGTGKTTLALIIAKTTGARFEKLNAVTAGIADIRKIVESARERLRLHQGHTILFIDEIHRFNKSQQDALLPHVENGTVTLIGATTENPYFEVNSPLLSRTRIVRLQKLARDAIIKILFQAINDPERGLGSSNIKYDDATLMTIAEISGGDARVALNILEQTALMLGPDNILTPEIVAAVAGEKIQVYDKQGDNHYDVVSAFIKSMRGSDPDAALHYLARMIVAGEDVKFIARRIVICAAEDVGNADPQALVIATAAAQGVQFVGMPEARILLAQAVTYIATAPKSNASYTAIDTAIEDVRRTDCGEVPLHLRDSSYKGAKQFGHGKEYLYPHSYPNSYVEQQYLPDKIANKSYYQPTQHGYEAILRERLQALRRKK